MKLARLALLAALLLAVGAGFVRWHRAVPPRLPGELRIVHGPIRLSLDPRAPRDSASLSRRLIDALWEPLLVVDAQGEVQAAAAEAWTLSPDLRRVTLRLRDDLRWSNGEPVTAADFIRTIGWVERSGGGSALFRMLQTRTEGAPRAAVESLRVADERTLILNLPQATPGAIFAIAAARWAPLHATSLAVLESGSYRAHPERLITSGPFKLAEASRKTWRLVRDPQFRHADRPALESVRLVRTDGRTLYPSVIAAGLADVSDAADYLPVRLRPIEPPARFHVENTTGVSVLHFNTHKPPLDDPRVRRALSLALDRNTLAASLTAGGGLPAFACVPPVDGEEPVRTVEENVAEARRLLADAGYPDGRGLPVLRLPLLRSPASNPMAYYCAEQWRARLGLRVYVIPLSAAEIGARLARGEFDLMHYYWTLDRGDVSLLAFAPLADLPLAYQVSLSRDQAHALAAANGLRGEPRRAALVELERALMADAPCTPVVFYRRCYVLGPDIRGWKTDSVGEHPLAELSVADSRAP